MDYMGYMGCMSYRGCMGCMGGRVEGYEYGTTRI